ncbi:MAG: family 78 glycoside hydrolase catalytic domain [Lentimicrobium sp.]|jgi:hypothetical protein|nr:family 78 glycoside hydrolase catalytic domain [Lentimicrobium sp.]
MRKHSFFLVIVSLLLNCAVFASEFGVNELRVEQKINPVSVGTLSPRFSWKISSTKRGFKQSAYRIVVSDNYDDLLKNKRILFDSKKTKTSESILQEFGNLKLKPATTYFWKVMVWNEHAKKSTWSCIANFTTGLMSVTDWSGAKWISFEADNPESYLVPGIHAPLVRRQIGDKAIGMYKLPIFRREFSVEKELAQALVFVSGLGHFDYILNGEKVGDNFLDPGWTNYKKSAIYVGFDITDRIKKDNTIGVMLGNGFYNVPRERYFKQLISYGAPKFISCLILKYKDGSSEKIISDSTWKTNEGPIRFSSIFGGEDYDARIDNKLWRLNGFDDSSWKQAIESNPDLNLIPQMDEPLKIRQSLKPMKIYKNSKGNWIYDLGQNFSGIISIRLSGEQGQTVVFRPGELLNRDSTVNQSASGSPFLFKYTLNGDSVENWQPQFTYYGFRYVEVLKATPIGKQDSDTTPVIIELAGLHTTNSAQEIGHFSCSLPLFNNIYNLIDWAIRSNLASILTDCPHREKLGWLEVAHLMQYSMQYRYDLSGFYTKVMNDMADAQTPEGFIPSIAPEYVRFADGFENSPEWGSAFIIIPWYLYQWYGDKSLFTKHYSSMQKYLDYLSSRAKNNIIDYGLGDWFDLGPKNPGVSQLTSIGVTATGIYYYNTTIMSKMAEILGRFDDKRMYDKLASEIKMSFNQKYFNSSTLQYDRNSQAANAIALRFGLVEDKYVSTIHQNLIDEIKSRNYALTAGDIGYRYLLNVLDDFGDSDVIYKMNTKYNTPGYGFQLAHGATALTESWQAYGFVSNNHAMLGHFMEWLFSGLGGVKQDSGSRGFKSIIIKPQPTHDIKQARVKFDSSYGIISSEWEVRDDKFILLATIPANTSATIYLPVNELKNIYESGISVSNNTSYEVVGKEGKYWLIKVGSGNYHFTVSK